MKIEQANKPLLNFSLASLTDIVMLLLIFFLLSSAYIIQPGIKVLLPQSDTAQVIEEKNVIVTVTRDGIIYIGNEKTNLSSLAAMIRRHIVQGSTQTIVINADKMVTVNTLVSVIDRIKAAGGERFLIATEQEFD